MTNALCDATLLTFPEFSDYEFTVLIAEDEVTPRDFWVKEPSGQVVHIGVVANTDDLRLIACALTYDFPFLTGQSGVVAVRFENRVEIACGSIQYTLDHYVDTWWKRLTKNDGHLDTFFQSVHHDGLILSPFSQYLLVENRENRGWLQEILLEDISQQGLDYAYALATDNYGGRHLICPENHRIRITELCSEPGSYYGPWRIMFMSDDGSRRLVGGCDGDLDDTIAKVRKMQAEGIPDPIPDWREDRTKVIELPKGLTAVIRPDFSTLDDIWIETYTAEVLDHNHNPLLLIGLGESLEDAIHLRDDTAYLFRLLEKHCLRPDFDPEEDNSDKRKPLPVLPEFRFYGERNAVEHHAFEGGIEVMIDHNIPTQGPARHCRANIRISDRVTLRLLAYRIDETRVSFEVLIDDQVVDVGFHLHTQGLEPILRRVLRGEITEDFVLQHLEPEAD